MTKLMVAFRNFANVPKKEEKRCHNRILQVINLGQKCQILQSKHSNNALADAESEIKIQDRR
jgi:hypothetical protein